MVQSEEDQDLVIVGVSEDLSFGKYYGWDILLGYGDGVFYGWNQGGCKGIDHGKG